MESAAVIQIFDTFAIKKVSRPRYQSHRHKYLI